MYAWTNGWINSGVPADDTPWRPQGVTFERRFITTEHLYDSTR